MLLKIREERKKKLWKFLRLPNFGLLGILVSLAQTKNSPLAESECDVYVVDVWIAANYIHTSEHIP